MITKEKLTTNPIAPSSSIVQGNTYRITVLTSRLFRLEYSKDGRFQDLPTQIVINRDFDTPEFEVYETEQSLEIITAELHLTYDKKEFSGNGLSIHVMDKQGKHMSYWHYGQKTKNLGGTARTLDDVNGPVAIEGGLMSKEGYSIIDDSKSVSITSDNWIKPRMEEATDLYFFGYGRDYWQALKDFYQLTGPTPLLPRYTLGNWWSRYHPYSETDYKELMNKFQDNKVPFSVAVIDMDWHLTSIDPKYGSGWTGYTWNRELFPEPAEFMKWLHDRNMKVTLNVHPADGIRPSEEMYAQMAEAMGVNNGRNPMIPFDITNAEFAKAYLEVVHHPNEEAGVDFWWIDWQQGTNTKVEGLDPLWMLNHYHYLDQARDGKRPLILSRYAGVGSHRYPIGFSGDTHATWESLDFQPYFTANASNIGYGWWSHDIGGHMLGIKDDEMVTRWIQFGVFSPINRLHSSDNIFSGKEPWNYAQPYEAVIGTFLNLRHQLVPYLYSMNKRSHEEGKPIMVPLYYDNPWNQEAYEYNNEYLFGTEMLVAPITKPIDKATQLASVAAWIPEGDWIDFFTGEMYSGNTRTTLYRGISEIPVLVKQGGIIPLSDLTDYTNSTENPKQLELRVFAGASNSFTMWEDCNEEKYNQKSWLATTFTLNWEETPTFTIHAAEGNLAVSPEIRDYKVKMVNVPRQSVKVTVDDHEIAADVKWDNHCLKVSIPNVINTQLVRITLEIDVIEQKNKLERVYDLLNKTQMEYALKLELYHLIKQDRSFSKLIRDLESRQLPKELFGALCELLGSDL
ncbi:glycoside hydrolase family 31 protein [Paenibacillus glycanilyticus]|uniref:Alpha-glucosidase n=1 Tax=Paenibacillus glycanilyticus TaxID=126569 RepID=A0ABQ6G986_9BACL|nr:TIM-barrel domain-containing protein [Paenibacillus glycanilyticus]GLX66610.1 alpha-glucosidase [Paenibacillus glycanilyticus]